MCAPRSRTSTLVSGPISRSGGGSRGGPGFLVGSAVAPGASAERRVAGCRTRPGCHCCLIVQRTHSQLCSIWSDEQKPPCCSQSQANTHARARTHARTRTHTHTPFLQMPGPLPPPHNRCIAAITFSQCRNQRMGYSLWASLYLLSGFFFLLS